MTVLITGAAGFVGSYLLERNPKFIGTDFQGQNSRIVDLDLMDSHGLLNLLQSEQVTEIVHLAGVQFTNFVSRKERQAHFKQNIDIAESLTYAANLANVQKLIYVSTDMVYGENIKSPVDEAHPTCPIGEYGNSKLQAEKIFSTEGLFSLIIIRPRLILGPGRRGTIDKLAKLINSPLPLIFIGNGKNRYQFIGVHDLCIALELFLKSNCHGIFNIGSDNPPILNEVFSKTLFSLGKKKYILRIPSKTIFPFLSILDKLNFGPLAPEQYRIANLDYVLNTSKLKSAIGWTASQNDQELLTMALKELL